MQNVCRIKYIGGKFKKRWWLIEDKRAKSNSLNLMTLDQRCMKAERSMLSKMIEEFGAAVQGEVRAANPNQVTLDTIVK